MTNSRDIGLPGVGAGKGSAPRTKLTKDYQDRVAALGLTRDVWGEPIMAKCWNYKQIAPGRYRRTFK